MVPDFVFYPAAASGRRPCRPLPQTPTEVCPPAVLKTDGFLFLEKLTSQGLVIRMVMCYHITVLKHWRTSKQSRGAQDVKERFLR